MKHCSTKHRSTHHSQKILSLKANSLNLNEDLFPIGRYISDRQEMLNQMLTSLGWKHVRTMLPPQLKNASVSRIKELILGELLGMSEERIISILDGQQLENSSESEPENHKYTVRSKIVGTSISCNSNYIEPVSMFKESWCASMHEGSRTHSAKIAVDIKEGCIGEGKNLHDKGLATTCDIFCEEESNGLSDLDTLQIGITSKEVGELLQDGRGKKLNVENNNEQSITHQSDVTERKGKTMLEILELEMRARAIRALLKQQVDSSDINYSDTRSASQSPVISIHQPYMDELNSHVVEEHSSGIENISVHSENPLQKDDTNSMVINNKLLHNVSMDCASSHLYEISALQNTVSCIDNITVNSKKTLQKNNPGGMITNNSLLHGANMDCLPSFLYELPSLKNSVKSSILQLNIENNLNSKDDLSNTVIQERSRKQSKKGNNSWKESLIASENKLKCSKINSLNHIHIKMQIPTTHTGYNFPSLQNTSNAGHQSVSSWTERWLQSKGVQKVVTTSRMCTKIRKKMKSVQKLKQELTSIEAITQITGSVNEYKTLRKVNCIKNSSVTSETR